MKTLPPADEMMRAFLGSDPAYDGVFFTPQSGVATLHFPLV